MWPFAECYREKYGGLPPSQQREAVKRLTGRRRNPLTPEQCAEPSDEILAVLTAVNAAYLNKKARSKASSATKRMIQKAHPEPAEPEPEALADAIAAVSLEPATIVAEAEPAPAPTPARVTAPPVVVPPKSDPIPVPMKKPTPAAAPAPVVVPVGKPATQKSGLGAMLKR